MVIVCPYCQHRSNLREAKPGKYKPKCSKCEKRFRLEVPEDVQASPIVQPLNEAGLVPSIPDEPRPSPKQAEIPPATVVDDATIAAVTTGPLANSPAEVTRVEQPVSPADQTAMARFDATMVVSQPQDAFEATAVSTATPVVASDGASHAIPERLGGYRILRELGSGAMGSVYLAKQLSLDRLVALKVIQGRFAQDPTFLARFTREAYAAAQLVHHNVVQIYDLGSEGRTNFFSMEFVRGTNLADISQEQGPIEPRTAVGYVLQAARGLEFAHNHGMVHRDVKPANLMINEQGVVKVADLGLVKTPDPDSEELDTAERSSSDASLLSSAMTHVTMNNSMLGTPSYMAPEQAKNASQVDHRADIYSLGCTLYALLTGRPPFAGKTVMEVISKHRGEPVVRPELIVEKIPAELSDIVMRMVAKSPDDRYPTAGAVVAALEKFLAIRGEAPTVGNAAHVETLEACLASYNGSLLAKTRGLLILAFVAVCVTLGLICLLISLKAALGMGVFLCASVVAYFVTSGWRERTYLFEKVREFVFQSPWSDRLTWLGALALAVLMLWILGAAWMGLVGAVLGTLMGVAVYFVIDRKVATDRAASLQQMEVLLKQLRLQGIDETALRQFIAKFSGDQWEEFFEALFGFEAKLAARDFRQAEGLRPGKRFRGWREPLIGWLANRLKVRRDRQTREHLTRVEQEGLKATGISLEEARSRAQRMAAALVEQASAGASSAAAQTVAVDPAAAAAAKRARIKAMLAEARGGQEPPRHSLRDSLHGWLNLVMGARVRFVAGCLLMIGCGLWMQQNGVVSGAQVKSATAQAIEQRQLGELSQVKLDVGQTKPLRLPIVGRYFDSLNAGIAGLILLVSSLFRGWPMSLFAFPAAVIAMLGPSLGMPGIAALGGSYVSSAAAALALAFIGLIFGRTSLE